MAVVAAWSLRRAQAFRVAVTFGDEAGGQWRGGREGTETVSKDSSIVSPSSVPVPVQSRSMGNVVSALVPPTGAELSPSEESKTEWKEDREEAATCPLARRVPSVVEGSVSEGG